MPEELSANLSMPSQAQKHVTHNEALMVLDALVQLTVADRDLAVPPSSPVNGDRHIVSAAAAGLWGGPAQAIAVFVNGEWAFYAPRPGWQAYVLSENRTVVWQAGIWQDVLASLSALPMLGINTAADTTNRLAVASAATLLSHNGAGHQLKVNKAATTDTASLLFQDNWSGRAEMGLAGNDDFSVKVSANGTAWAEALRLEAATGKGLFGFGLGVQGAITGTAVTQSATDSTAGRLLKVGDFGVGGATAAVPGGTIDAVTLPSGLYNVVAADTGAKPAGEIAGHLTVTREGTGTATRQIWAALASDRVFLRRGGSSFGAWSPWREVFHQGSLLGPVAQTAGVPTGAVIEQASNANGTYIRFADGTQICSHKRSVTGITTASGSIFISANQNWVFPAAFIAAPVMSGVGGGSARWLGGTSATPTIGSVRAMSGLAEAGSTTIEIMAVGRWY